MRRRTVRDTGLHRGAGGHGATGGVQTPRCGAPSPTHYGRLGEGGAPAREERLREKERSRARTPRPYAPRRSWHGSPGRAGPGRRSRAGPRPPPAPPLYTRGGDRAGPGAFTLQCCKQRCNYTLGGDRAGPGAFTLHCKQRCHHTRAGGPAGPGEARGPSRAPRRSCTVSHQAQGRLPTEGHRGTGKKKTISQTVAGYER